MLEEVDFRKEAEHVAEFAAFLDSRGFRSLATTPYVYKQHSGRRLLTMEKLVGVPLTDYDAIRSVTTRWAGAGGAAGRGGGGAVAEGRGCGCGWGEEAGGWGGGQLAEGAGPRPPLAPSPWSPKGGGRSQLGATCHAASSPATPLAAAGAAATAAATPGVCTAVDSHARCRRCRPTLPHRQDPTTPPPPFAAGPRQGPRGRAHRCAQHLVCVGAGLRHLPRGCARRQLASAAGRPCRLHRLRHRG
jgi:hypothetical protein